LGERLYWVIIAGTDLTTPNDAQRSPFRIYLHFSSPSPPENIPTCL